MNETLSVIEEHMQDMTTPRESLLVPRQRLAEDSESEYSSHLNDRQSYVAGNETDEEDYGKLTEAEVKSWNHRQTAQHLRNVGVDPQHCDIFEEQEINGEVLLDMDQAFIYMKEFDFGVMGRRLKTWHKIRSLQDEVRGNRESPQTTKSSVSNADSFDPFPQSQNLPGASYGNVQRMPGRTEPPASAYQSQQQANNYVNDTTATPHPLQTQSTSNNRSSFHGSIPPSPWRASGIPDSPSRPSAALIREISHSRRHSSIDLNNQPLPDLPTPSTGATTPHKKQASFDRGWSLMSSTPLTTSTTAPSSRLAELNQQNTNGSFGPSLYTEPSTADLLDRGYFSGPESDSRRSRNVLRKRDSQASPVHSRQSSMLDGSNRTAAAAVKKHSRLSSVDSIKDLPSRMVSPAARAYHSKAFKGRMRSSSARTPSPLPYASAVSPTVTNLENGTSPNPQLQPARTFTSPPISGHTVDKARKVMGLRAISDAVTGNERALASPIGAAGLSESPVDSPTGSNTPSATSRSFDIDNADTSSKGTEPMASTPAAKELSRPRLKTKKQTSAYTQGLVKVGPVDSRKTADYAGWMKKKSAGILTTWKPRLFILHGRRLSYYYSEKDTEERGVIDISGHKVLVANSEPVTTLHATITGAASSSPQAAGTASSAETSPAATRSPNPNTSSNTTSMHSGPFYFKLVPPKAGFSRAVQFTRPTIHYFQVDGIIEGRKWMGEMMKATIEHDLSTFETTNKQKTISLAKARARRERPPALWDTDTTAVGTPDQASSQADGIATSTAPQAAGDQLPTPAETEFKAGERRDSAATTGLQIQGLSFEKENRTPGERSSFEGIFDEKHLPPAPDQQVHALDGSGTGATITDTSALDMLPASLPPASVSAEKA